MEHWKGLRTFKRSQTEIWGDNHQSDSDNEVDDGWSDSDEERGEDSLRTSEYLKLVEARLPMETGWYHPELVLARDGEGVGGDGGEDKGGDEGEDKGEGEDSLEAYSQMSEEALVYVDDEQSGVV